MAISTSEIFSAIALAFAGFQYLKNTTVSKDNAALERRVAILESHPQETAKHEQRIAVLESLHAGHGEQISELKTEVGKMGVQLNELFRQMVGVQEKLASNSAVFTDKFDQILAALRQVQK